MSNTLLPFLFTHSRETLSPSLALSCCHTMPDAGYWILDPWSVEFGFQSLIVSEFQLPWTEFQITKHRIPDFRSKISQIPEYTCKHFPDSRIQITLHGTKHCVAEKKVCHPAGLRHILPIGRFFQKAPKQPVFSQIPVKQCQVNCPSHRWIDLYLTVQHQPKFYVGNYIFFLVYSVGSLFIWQLDMLRLVGKERVGVGVGCEKVLFSLVFI